MWLHRTRVGFVTACLAVHGTANADIIHVPADEPTIQAGIDAAMDGDEVVVAPGTYFETIDFNSKAITVRSSDGPQVTTIDAQRLGTVVTCVSGQGMSLEGFTITGGDAAVGGGMINDNSSPSIVDCVFVGNTADE